MVICVSIVAVSAFLGPLTGQCGTGPSLMFQLLGALVRDAVTLVWSISDDRMLQKLAASLFNVGFFLLTIVFWYVKGPHFLPNSRPDWSTAQGTFVIGLFAWTGFYVASYLFLFPTTSCL
jgi:hypothetical protein